MSFVSTERFTGPAPFVHFLAFHIWRHVDLTGESDNFVSCMPCATGFRPMRETISPIPRGTMQIGGISAVMGMIPNVLVGLDLTDCEFPRSSCGLHSMVSTTVGPWDSISALLSQYIVGSTQDAYLPVAQISWRGHVVCQKQKNNLHHDLCPSGFTSWKRLNSVIGFQHLISADGMCFFHVQCSWVRDAKAGVLRATNWLHIHWNIIS